MKRAPQRRRPRRALAGTIGVALGLAVLTAWPLHGHATAVNLVERLTAGSVADVVEKTRIQVLDEAELERKRLLALRQEAEDPKTQPPLHGTAPHGQGTVAVIDVNPSTDRPTGSDPAGSDTEEDVVVGRARGEQGDDGAYHGHITIAALFGNEILGVDTAPGETQHGPLNAVQEGLLTPLCDGSGGQICLSAVTADSTTTDEGSTNRFSAAHVTLGGADGIDAGAAESNGNISDDGTCQSAHGDSSVASVRAGGQAVADVARSSTDSTACKGQEPAQANDSRVIALGGTGVPLPAAGCADGTPDVVTGIPTLAPIVCNANDADGSQAEAPYGVRDALSVFVLDAGGSQLLATKTAGSESRAQAPRPQCSDGRDNDGDGKVDADDPGCDGPNDDDETDDSKPQCSDEADNDGDGKADSADPGCHTDGDPGNPASYDPRDDDETDKPKSKPECSDEDDNDGDGRVDSADPGCHTDGDPGNPASYDPRDDDESDDGRGTSRTPECSDRADNDGDGNVDADDPGCLSGPGGTYNPDDDDESDDRREAGSLPMTGSDTLLLAIAGLLLLGAGLDLRRRMARGVAG